MPLFLKKTFEFNMTMRIVKFLRTNYMFLLLIFLALGFFARVKNLNYNSPFNDEAIYVVVGQVGLFKGDWYSYNAASWMAGSQYIYPSITAIAYRVGGIVGSRVVNVIFGIGLTFFAYLTILKIVKPQDGNRYLSGFITLGILTFFPVGIYVSRLATYDMPSFFFLILSFYLLNKANHEIETKEIAKFYLLSAISMYLAFLTKIVAGIYIPFIVFYSVIELRKRENHFSLWKKYFLVPFVTILSIHLTFNLKFLYSYFVNQEPLEIRSYGAVIEKFWSEFYLISPFLTIGSVGMILTKNKRQLALLSFATLLPLLFHLVFKNAPSLDKHTFLSVCFAAMISGIGIAGLIELMRKKVLKNFLIGNLVGSVFLFSYFSYGQVFRYNELWSNTDNLDKFISSVVGDGDKVLAESGASVVLASSGKDFPTNVVTFDWLQYGNLTGREAYAKATQDGYFNFIQLEDLESAKLERNSKLSSVVFQNMSENYYKIYSKKGFVVYKRSY